MSHIPRAITVRLRLPGVDIVTAQEDNSANLADPELLERATALQRVLFTFDDDLLVEATKRQLEGNPFTGLVYAHPSRVSIGSCIRDIEIIAKAAELDDIANRVEFRLTRSPRQNACLKQK